MLVSYLVFKGTTLNKKLHVPYRDGYFIAVFSKKQRFEKSQAYVASFLTKAHRLVMMAEGSHAFPSRTRPLSPPAPMVLDPQGSGRVGRRQANYLNSTLCYPMNFHSLIAQLVEHSTVNRVVTGSSPVRGAIWRGVRAGRRSTIGNRVGVTSVSRVRIPLSP